MVIVTLLSILIVMGVSMVGMALYFNKTYEAIGQDYEQALKDVREKAKELNETAGAMNEREAELKRAEQEMLDYINELNLTKSRVSSLGTHFTTLKSDKEILEANLSKTTTERDDWMSKYTSTKTSLDICTRDYNIKAERLKASDTKIGVLKADAIEVEGDINYVLAQANKIESNRRTLKNLTMEISNVLSGMEGDDKDRVEDLVSEMDGYLDNDGYMKGWTDTIVTLVGTIKNRIATMKNV